MTENARAATVVISVRGVGFADSPAERATVALSVGFDGPDRTDVRERSTRVHAECLASIAALHDASRGPIIEWSSDDVQVWSERPWNAEGNQLPPIFHSRASVTVTFTDFLRLSLWLEDAAARDGVSLGGVSWTVTDLTRRELEARAQRDAVAHAIDKASVYATSLGHGGVTPLELSEPTVFAQPFGRREDARMFAMAGAPTVDLSPAPVRIEVEIHAKFSALAAQPSENTLQPRSTNEADNNSKS